MKKIFYLILFITSAAQAQDFLWQQRPFLPATMRYNPVGFSSDVSGFIGLGINNGTVLTDLWKFDPVSATWTQQASFPGGGRFGASCFVIGDFAYVGCGWNAANVAYTDFYRYNFPSNTWSSIASYPGTPFYTGVNFSIGGKGYTGVGFSPYTLEFYEYDTTSNVWTRKADFAGGIRQSSYSFSYNNKGYVTTGSHGWPANPYNDMWEYNPLSNQWTQKASMPGSVRYSCAGFLIDSIAYVGLGLDGTNYFNNMFAYNIITNTWTVSDSFPSTARAYPGCFTIGNSGYMCAGGISGQNINFNDLWEFGKINSVKELSEKNKILHYPNPCNSSFTINTSGYYKGGAQLLMYDAIGKLILRKSLTDGENVIALNKGITSGTYIGVYKQQNLTESFKITVVR